MQHPLAIQFSSCCQMLLQLAPHHQICSTTRHETTAMPIRGSTPDGGKKNSTKGGARLLRPCSTRGWTCATYHGLGCWRLGDQLIILSLLGGALGCANCKDLPSDCLPAICCILPLKGGPRQRKGGFRVDREASIVNLQLPEGFHRPSSVEHFVIYDDLADA